MTYSNVPISQFSPTPPYASLTEFSVAQFIFEPSVIILQYAFTVYAPGVDTDRDGMPDEYEAAHGLVNGTDDAALDADGDGQPNVAEYQAGTAASNPADALRILSIAKTGTPGVFAVTLASVPGKRYQLQKSTDLGTTESWSATGPATNAAAAPATTTTLQTTLSGSHQFLRAMVLP